MRVDFEITKIIYILNASSNTSLDIIRMFDSGKNIESNGKKDKKVPTHRSCTPFNFG